MLLDYRLAAQSQLLIADPTEKRQAQVQLQRLRRDITLSQATRFLARWLDPREQGQQGQQAMVWFWFNHFNVFANKGLVGAALPGYLDDAIRPHLRGRFADLLMAVLTHPAMLVYLDNTGNVANKLNENLARELLELHTLGVNAGYTQADIRETARLLTGFGLRPLDPVRWSAQMGPLVHGQGEFMFDPRRHDFNDKTILGRRYAGSGYNELQSLCEWLAVQPATATHIVGKMAVYLAGDALQSAVQLQAREVYLDTGGNLGATIELLNQLLEPLPGSFKTPMQWLLDSARLLADERPVVDAAPLQRWLAQLGQAMFGCSTPNGYPLRGAEWINAGQFTQRFELAPLMVARQEQVFGSFREPAALMASTAATALQNRAGPETAAAMARARLTSDQLALLLSSPEFMYRSRQ